MVVNLRTGKNITKVKQISTDRLFEKFGYVPHTVQRKFHGAKTTARFRVVDAGRRIGKSQMGGHELSIAAVQARIRMDELQPKGHRMEYWIVGPNYSDAEKEFRVAYADMESIGLPFDKPGTYDNVNGGNMSISLWGGRFLVHAKSADHPQTLVGEALHGVIFAEAAKIKPNVWTKYIRPTLADYARDPIPSWATFTSTPEGKNYFYDMYMRGQDPNDTEWWSIKAPSWSNPILFPDGRYDPEILDMSKDMTEEKFKQEIGAEFTEFVGRVFKRFTEEDNVGDYPYDPRWPVYMATDYGYTNPNVALFIQVDVFDNVWVCGEYYRRNRTASEFAQDVASDPKLGPLARAARLLYPDPAGPGDSAELAKVLGLQVVSNTGGPIGDRIDLIRRWLTPQPAELPDDHPDKVPKLQFDRSCVNCIREFNDYRYPDTKDETSEVKENPLKVDDHTPETLGRFFAGHYKQQVMEVHKARITKAKMRSKR